MIFTESRQRKGSFFNSFLFSKKGKKKNRDRGSHREKLKIKSVSLPLMYEISRENEKIKKKKKWIGAIDPLPLHFFRNSSNSISLPLSLFSLLNFSHRKKKSIHRVYVNLSMFSSEAFLIHVNSTIITIHVPTLNRD